MSDRGDVENTIFNMTKTSRERLDDWASERGLPHTEVEWIDVVDAWNEQQKIIDTYVKIISALAPEMTPSLFVAGHSDITTSDGLPKYLYICPGFGSDIVTTYKKR